MNKIFKADEAKNIGENWLIATFGCDEDGKEQFLLTTDNIHASEFAYVSLGAKGDAELCAELLNRYYNKQIAFVGSKVYKCNEKLSQLKQILTFTDGRPRDLITINDVEKMLDILDQLIS